MCHFTRGFCGLSLLIIVKKTGPLDDSFFLFLKVVCLVAEKLPHFPALLHFCAPEILDVQRGLGQVIQCFQGAFLKLSGLHNPDALGHLIAHASEREKNDSEQYESSALTHSSLQKISFFQMRVK